MKRLTLIIMAGLLMLGLTQCKKEQTNTNANAEGEWVTITVKVDAGDRHIVYPGTGAVVYSNGDKIYVGNNGHYVGTLTYNNGAFSGQIQSPSTADYLHFYFIGGEYTGTLNAGTTESFDWSIADQSEKLPVLSYGHSTQKYTDGNATYSCTLENQCALVEFSLTLETSDAVTVGGMLTNATIDFGTPGITPNTDVDSDDITLYSENTTTKWAILLPQDAVDGATVTIGSGNYTIDVPAIGANGYFHGTGSTPAVAIDNTPGPAHEYVDLGLPSGRLWATCNVGANAPEEYGDYFAWGETTPKNTYTSGNYTYSANPDILPADHDAATANWGSGWRMPTEADWDELLANTTVTWTTQNSVKGRKFTANGNSLFLPAAGYRDDGSLYLAGGDGYYWSSSLYSGNPSKAWGFDFDADDLFMYDSNPYYGRSVRAVRSAPQN